MSIAGQMQLLGHVDGIDWYWADPARFTKGGVYYWNGKENVRLSTMPVEPKLMCDRCGADRLKEDCKGNRLNCGIAGIAYSSPIKPVTTKPLQVGMEDIAKFAGLVLKAHRNDGEPGDVDGASLQAFALECGLIEEIEVNEPCSSRCTCLEYGGIYGFPQNCLFATVVGKSAIAAASPHTINEG